MRQAVAAKKRHIWSGERSQPLVEGQQRWFARQNVADQHDNEIDEIVMAKAGTGEVHLFGNRFQRSRV